MKKLIFILIVGSLIAQAEDAWKLGIKKIILLKYNSKLELTDKKEICNENCDVLYEWEDEWVISINEMKKVLGIDEDYIPIEGWFGNYKYDLNDNLIKEYNEKGDSIIYTYDSKNNLVKKLRYWGNRPSDRDSSFYSYDSDNNLVKEFDFSCTSGGGYDFNGNGVVDEGEEGGKYKICGSREGKDFKYDSNGNLIEIYDGYLGGSHFYTQRTVLSYNWSNNLLIEELIYNTGRDFSGERLSDTYTYKYNSKNHIIEKIFYFGNEKSLSSKQVYEYEYY